MYVRTSCGVAIDKASPMLADRIRELGVKPIITNIIIRAVYEGTDKKLAESIVALFEKEEGADIYYDPGKEVKTNEAPVQRQNRKRHRKNRRS